MSIQALERGFRFSNLKPDPRGVAFFILVPLALAIMTATTTGYSRSLGYGGALLYVGLLSIIPWWIGEGTTRIAWYGLRRFKPPLWLLCKVGILIACLIVGPYVSLVTGLFSSYWPGAALERELAAGGGSVITESVMQILRATFFWVTANYVFDRFLDYPRFRYEEKSTKTSTQVEPLASKAGQSAELLQRLASFQTLSDIQLVKAEEHYVRVVGEGNDELVSFKFRDALKDLENEDGFQVHRSYWVRRKAVVGAKEDGPKLTLEMSNGSIVPVSGPYRALVRQVF